MSAQLRAAIEAVEVKNRDLQDRLVRLRSSMTVQRSSIEAMRVPIPSEVGPEGEPSVFTESRSNPRPLGVFGDRGRGATGTRPQPSDFDTDGEATSRHVPGGYSIGGVSSTLLQLNWSDEYTDEEW